MASAFGTTAGAAEGAVVDDGEGDEGVRVGGAGATGAGVAESAAAGVGVGDAGGWALGLPPKKCWKAFGGGVFTAGAGVGLGDGTAGDGVGPGDAVLTGADVTGLPAAGAGGGAVVAAALGLVPKKCWKAIGGGALAAGAGAGVGDAAGG